MKRIYTIFAIACLMILGSLPLQSASLSEAEIRADFEQLYTDLQSASYDFFAHTPRAEFDKHFEQFSAEIHEEMSELEIHKLFMRFAALANIAHTRIDFPIRHFREFIDQEGKTLPIEIRVVNGEVIIKKYTGTLAISPGDTLLTVNGQPALEWLQTLSQYLAADDDRLAYVLLEAWGVAPYLWLHDGEQSRYQLTLKSADTGARYEVSQPTMTYDAQESNTPTQEGAATELREYKLLTDGIGYLKPGEFYNVYAETNEQIWDTREFHNFIDEAMNSFLDGKVKDIVIDVRANAGGTNTFSDHLIAWFADQPFRFASEFRVKVSAHSRAANQLRLAPESDPESISVKLEEFYAQHAPGDVILFPLEDTRPHAGPRNIANTAIRIWVWVDRFSFSNAVSLAAITKDYQFGTVIGEKTADPATTYAAMESFTLNHTGISVGYPKALIIRPNGNPVADGVTPDLVLNCPEGNGAAAMNCLRSFVLENRTTR